MQVAPRQVLLQRASDPDIMAASADEAQAGRDIQVEDEGDTPPSYGNVTASTQEPRPIKRLGSGNFVMQASRESNI